jgi:uncharacterized protein YbjQ (UPF0145 family)
MTRQIIVTTSDGVDGYRVRKYLGVVRGIAVRGATPGQGFAALGQVLGGNLQASWQMYEQVCERARDDAFDHMVRHAEDLQADAVVSMRYHGTELTQGLAEVLAYGTAVQLELPEAQAATAT